MKQVGIIGAGASGLCALRHSLTKEGITPIVWEHSQQIGGTWVYTDNTGMDEYGYPIQSSMYKNLRTNLPKEIMAFPDFTFKKGEKSFIHHSEVLEYLNEYADYFKLEPFIKFCHHVKNVEPIEKYTEDGSFPKWKVDVINLQNGSSTTVECDALFVCNGHYSTPRYPDIENLDSFDGKVMHSHNYRLPDAFLGAKVLILGAAASGIDIALELSKVAEKVYLSHNLPVPIPSTLPPNLRQVKGITKAESNGFKLADNSFVEADALLLCTGYEYSFPFLSESCGVTVEGNTVKPLYRHIINCGYPSMGFIGIPFQICPFPLFDVQVQYYLKVLLGLISLPNNEEMTSEIAAELEEKLKQGHAVRHFHKMGQTQWQYTNKLEGLAQLTPVPAVVQMIYTHAHSIRRQYLTTYKDSQYVITGDDSFESNLDRISTTGL